MQISGTNSVSDINSYLSSQFGPLASLFHYTLSTKSKYAAASSVNAVASASTQSGHVHWVLAEFNKSEDFLKALESTRHAEGNLPFISSMCWFGQNQSLQSVKSKSRSSDLKIVTERLNVPSDTVDFSKAKTVSLYNSNW